MLVDFDGNGDEGGGFAAEIDVHGKRDGEGVGSGDRFPFPSLVGWVSVASVLAGRVGEERCSEAELDCLNLKALGADGLDLADVLEVGVKLIRLGHDADEGLHALRVA